MGEFSEAHQAHLGSAAAQKGSVGGRRWACRSGPPQSRLEVTVLALAGSWWWTGRPRDPSPSALRRAQGLQGWSVCPGCLGEAVLAEYLTGRGIGQGSGVGGWARWFSCIHGRMSSGLSGRSPGSPGLARPLACWLACLLALSLSVCVSPPSTGASNTTQGPLTAQVDAILADWLARTCCTRFTCCTCCEVCPIRQASQRQSGRPTARAGLA